MDNPQPLRTIGGAAAILAGLVPSGTAGGAAELYIQGFCAGCRMFAVEQTLLPGESAILASEIHAMTAAAERVGSEAPDHRRHVLAGRF